MANVDKTVTNIPLIRESGVTVTKVAFTSDTTAGDTETLNITPTVPGNRMILIINNVATDQGSLTVNCAKGEYWFAKAMPTVTILQATSQAIVFQAAAHQDKDTDLIAFVVTPASTKKLVTNHAATWQCFQMPD